MFSTRKKRRFSCFLAIIKWLGGICNKLIFSQSVAALDRIAQKKGYVLVALTQTNAIFVHKKEFPKFADFETNFWALNVNDGYLVMVTTYDGKYAFVKNGAPQYFYGITQEYDGQILGSCRQWDGQPIQAVYQVSNEH